MMRRLPLLPALCALVCATLLLSGCGGRARDAAADPAETSAGTATPAGAATSAGAVAPVGAQVMAGTGGEAYDFTLERLDGGTLTLSDLRGGWALVNFWATWCPPCVKEMPYLEELAQSREIAVVGVNMNEPRARVEKFVAEAGVTFPILLEPDDVVKIMYEARALPRSALVAPDGTVAGIIMGAFAPEKLEAWLDEQGVPLR